MSKIRTLHALEILDSRGNPTLKVIASSDDGFTASACIPSGASTGTHEAVELRDKDPKRYQGKGVLKAVGAVNGPLAHLLHDRDIKDQQKIDTLMIQADGTPNKSHYGANAILGVSLAIAHLAAASQKMPLFKYFGHHTPFVLPCPMVNIINGGAHADNTLDFQEFMIRPIGAPCFEEAIRYCAETFHSLKELLKKAGFTTAVGDEGGFAPQLASAEEALDFILKAIEKAGYKVGVDISLALDCAASEFYDIESSSYVEKKKKQRKEPAKSRSSEEQALYLAELCKKYPIDSIEDGLAEEDWKGWKFLTQQLGSSCQLVGDDIFVTNLTFLKRGIEESCGNAILIKPNQIGTLSETLQTIEIAKKNRFATIISHRSGETEDTTIADLSVALELYQIKTGSMSRSERVAKYNRLLEIENLYKNETVFAGKKRL